MGTKSLCGIFGCLHDEIHFTAHKFSGVGVKLSDVALPAQLWLKAVLHILVYIVYKLFY